MMDIILIAATVAAYPAGWAFGRWHRRRVYAKRLDALRRIVELHREALELRGLEVFIDDDQDPPRLIIKSMLSRSM